MIFMQKKPGTQTGGGEVQKPPPLYKPGDGLHPPSETGCRASAGLPGAAASEEERVLFHKVINSEKQERGQCEVTRGPFYLVSSLPTHTHSFPFLLIPGPEAQPHMDPGEATPGQHTAFCANTDVNVQPTQEREPVQPGDVGGEWSLEPLYRREARPRAAGHVLGHLSCTPTSWLSGGEGLAVKLFGFPFSGRSASLKLVKQFQGGCYSGSGHIWEPV